MDNREMGSYQACEFLIYFNSYAAVQIIVFFSSLRNKLNFIKFIFFIFPFFSHQLFLKDDQLTFFEAS